MKCDYCQVINGAKERPGGIIYQNPYIIVFLGSQHHKGHTAVVLRKHKTDLLELSKPEREYFFDFMLEIAKAVKRAMKPDKLNYALLGNWIHHLHWHIYPRYKTDKDWGEPPTLGKRIIYYESEMQEIAQRIKNQILLELNRKHMYF